VSLLCQVLSQAPHVATRRRFPPGWSCTASTDEVEEIPGQDLRVEARRYVVDGAIYVGDPSRDSPETPIVALHASGE
jgi:hypothetical protein